MTHAPIILATKPFTGTPGPLAVAQWLAVREGRPLRLVCVLDPFEEAGIYKGSLRVPRYVEEECEWIAKRIDSALHESPYARLDTQVEVVDGSVPGTLERLAHEEHASLLVMGSGHRGGINGPLAQQVLRTARIPLLIVPADATARPLMRAVAAIDFTAPSIRAAAEVLPLLASDGRLTLCHVRPPSGGVDSEPRSTDAYLTACAEAFGSLIRALPLQPGISVDTIVLEGDVAACIDNFATMHRADILACGRRAPDAPQAQLLGSVSAGIVRQARIPVLVSPDMSASKHVAFEWAATAMAGAGHASNTTAG